MSNATAIAAVTGALHALLGNIATLQSALADLKITASPLDQAGTDPSHNALNIFLYQVLPNAAFRNLNVPRQLPAGATASPLPDLPPSALDLHYLITAYGKDNDDTLAHLILGQAVSLLGDNGCLAPALLQQPTVNPAITGIDLHRQTERVRLTPLSLSIEEMSKLWSVCHPKYRISVAYQASVVLIDSSLPPRSPLPVLAMRIGAASRPLPALTGAAPPTKQRSARLGDALTLDGSQLDGSQDNLTVRLQSPLLTAPLTATVVSRSATAITVQLPDDTAARTSWPAGSWMVWVSRDDPPQPGGGTPTQSTNAVPFTLAPAILGITPPSAPGPGAVITVQCSPQVWPKQRVSLLVGDVEIPAPPPSGSTPTDTLAFPAANLPSGTFFVRLRVDGVDSLLADFTRTPPAFDPAQQVTLP